MDGAGILGFDNTQFSVGVEMGDDYALGECESFKCLGLVVDSLLGFDIHVDCIGRGIQKRMGAVYGGGSLLPVECGRVFADSLILSHFGCLDAVCSGASETGLRELDILCKKLQGWLWEWRELKVVWVCTGVWGGCLYV